MLEDINNTSSIWNMLTAYPTWQQKINQTRSPDTAYVQQLSFETPWSPTYWNTDMASQQGVMMNTNVLTNNMMNTNMMNSNMMSYNSGDLNNK
jgi:preprotein translocase subunit SecB